MRNRLLHITFRDAIRINIDKTHVIKNSTDFEGLIQKNSFAICQVIWVFTVQHPIPILNHMNLPEDFEVDTGRLSGCFRHTSATYKFYWMLTLLSEVEQGRGRTEKKALFHNKDVVYCNRNYSGLRRTNVGCNRNIKISFRIPLFMVIKGPGNNLVKLKVFWLFRRTHYITVLAFHSRLLVILR